MGLPPNARPSRKENGCAWFPRAKRGAAAEARARVAFPRCSPQCPADPQFLDVKAVRPCVTKEPHDTHSGDPRWPVPDKPILAEPSPVAARRGQTKRLIRPRLRDAK